MCCSHNSLYRRLRATTFASMSAMILSVRRSSGGSVDNCCSVVFSSCMSAGVD